MKKKVNPLASVQAFTAFGAHQIAYMRKLDRTEVPDFVADEAGIANDTPLWGLFAADGRPLALSDEPAALVQSAQAKDMIALSIH